MTLNLRYQAGGTLDPDLAFYIPRRADDQLRDYCRQGQYAYLFNARQTGKSSLLERTRRALAPEMHVAVVSLERIGREVEAADWFHTLLSLITTELPLQTRVGEWWPTTADLSPSRRFGLFFETVVVHELARPVAVFLDEIDMLRGSPYRDDVFAQLRALHSQRARAPELRRLSFVVAGLATPVELIGETGITAYNIAQPLELGDLTENEGAVRTLADGLGLATPEARRQTLLRAEEKLGRPLGGEQALRDALAQPLGRVFRLQDVNFKPNKEGVNAMAFSPDGRWLVIGCWATAQLWAL